MKEEETARAYVFCVIVVILYGGVVKFRRTLNTGGTGWRWRFMCVAAHGSGARTHVILCIV